MSAADTDSGYTDALMRGLCEDGAAEVSRSMPPESRPELRPERDPEQAETPPDAAAYRCVIRRSEGSSNSGLTPVAPSRIPACSNFLANSIFAMAFR